MERPFELSLRTSDGLTEAYKAESLTVPHIVIHGGKHYVRMSVSEGRAIYNEATVLNLDEEVRA